MADERTKIGTVTSVNPHRREVRVKVERRRATEFEEMDWFRVVLRDGKELRCRVVSVRCEDDVAIIMLGAGTTRDNVRLMRSCEVVADAASATVAKRDAFDVEAMVGMTVRSMNGSVLGIIVAGFKAPGNDVAETEMTTGSSVLLPVIEEVILDIDWENKVVLVGDIGPFAVDDSPDGLMA